MNKIRFLSFFLILGLVFGAFASPTPASAAPEEQGTCSTCPTGTTPRGGQCVGFWGNVQSCPTSGGLLPNLGASPYQNKSPLAVYVISTIGADWLRWQPVSDPSLTCGTDFAIVRPAWGGGAQVDIIPSNQGVTYPQDKGQVYQIPAGTALQISCGTQVIYVRMHVQLGRWPTWTDMNYRFDMAR